MMVVLQRPGARAVPVLAVGAFATLLLIAAIPTASAGEVAFQELDADRCFMFSALLSYKTEGSNVTELPLELVIDNEPEYKKLFDPKLMRQSCAGVDPAKTIPKVDFSKQSVLGLWTSGSCADRGFKKKIWRDDRQQVIIYSVITVAGTRPVCMGPGPQSLNLVAVPKVPGGYKVEFESFHE